MNRTAAPKLFGTDGIRGKPGEEPLTPETIGKIAAAFAAFLRKDSGKNNLSVVIGKDTRASCAMIEQAIVAGFTDVGVDVQLLGVLPTAAVAYLARQLKADGGIMISASHNPANENGIKFFTSKGEKLNDAEEEFVERSIGLAVEAGASAQCNVNDISADAQQAYIDFLLLETNKPSFSGLKVVVDTANGAAYKIAETAFKVLGAETIVLANKPDGSNINRDCGALFPQQLQQKMIEQSADCGIALDGDADRLIMADEKGSVVDGDGLILAIAKDMLKQKKLAKNTVVVTEYSNTAFDDELESLGAKTVRVKNGDKYVYEEMAKNGYTLGGEQSGHIILEGNTTGDGILAALYVAALVKKSGKQLSELTRLEKKPQALINVEVKEKKKLSSLPLTSAAIAEAEKQLPGLKGRSLIRYSGTQNMLRIMLEGNNKEKIRKLAEEIAAAAKREIGA